MKDVIVVGRGLFGASAVRYLSQEGAEIAVIGPDEPADPASHEGVFGAHYDEGRLTYQLKSDTVWARLARSSLARFPSIEEASGVDFHSPVGSLYLADDGMDSGRFAAARNHKGNIFSELLDRDSVTRRFPFLKAGNRFQGLWEGPPAGYFSPRRFIEAQAKLSPGAELVNDWVVRLEVKQDRVLVKTAASGQYEARKVLVAAGAYTNQFGLMPRKLKLMLKLEFVIRAALSAEEAERLVGMVPIVYRIDHPRLTDLYILPPVRYPDGRFYLKMGANTDQDSFLETAEAVSGWYREGDSDSMLDEMRMMVQALFPGLQDEGWSTHRCVITRTTHGRPYIDTIIPDQLYVAVGGNGQGAKAADEVGRLAARLVLADENPGEAFSAVFH